jgi:hypothetical protein
MYSSSRLGDELRESTKVNVMSPDSMNILSPMDSWIETPKEQYISVVQARDHVEAQFDQLLVSTSDHQAG